MALSISGAGHLLVRIPTALFPIALGLAGLAAVSRVAAPVLDSDLLAQAGTVLLGLAAAMLIVDILLYLVKLLRHRREVAEDISMRVEALTQLGRDAEADEELDRIQRLEPEANGDDAPGTDFASAAP